MAVNALRGALAFLTRFPVQTEVDDWDAFRNAPWTFPVIGFLVGVVAAFAFLLPLPALAAAATYLLVLYLVTGVNHADGLADLGDAAAVHGADRRREVLKDSMLGVGGALALGVGIVGTAATVAGAASMGVYVVVRLVVAAEVGAKLGMAVLACLGDAAHEGFGSQFTDNELVDLAIPVAVSLPVFVFGPPGLALLGGPLVALGLRRWVGGWLGGVSGDVFGATNELGRLVGLLLGVLAWTAW